MEDMEKQRSENVVRMEHMLAHAQAEVQKYKAIAEKWEPICHAEVGVETVRFTLSFGGKRSTVAIDFASFASANTSIDTATVAIVDSLIQSNVANRLRETVRKEVQRIQQSLSAVQGAGKW